MPLASPTSKTVTMCGSDRAEAERASCSKRRSRSGSWENSSGSTLTATSRPSRVSRALYTSPMPPDPRGEITSYGPRRAPAASVIGSLHPTEEEKIRYHGSCVAVRVASAVGRDRDWRVAHGDDARGVRRHQLLPELATAG